MNPTAGLAYKPGWSFRLGGPGNRFLCVTATTADSLNPTRDRSTGHMWEIPEGLDERREFARWVFARLLDAERHEAAEFFEVDGHRPFWPAHDAGDPYAPAERW